MKCVQTSAKKPIITDRNRIFRLLIRGFRVYIKYSLYSIDKFPVMIC